MYHSALLSYDCGSTYEWGTDGEGSEIAYNYIHDNREVGIYLDNNSSNFSIHDNVLKKNGTGITLNSHNIDCLVENNYLIKNELNCSTYFYKEKHLNFVYSSNKIIKNNKARGKLCQRLSVF